MTGKSLNDLLNDYEYYLKNCHIYNLYDNSDYNIIIELIRVYMSILREDKINNLINE